MPSEHVLGIKAVNYLSYGAGSPSLIQGEVVDEVLACISVNGDEIAAFMCSPHDLDIMAVGFLYNEAIIDGLEEVRSIHVSKNKTCVEIWLKDSKAELPRRAIVTAGCGGGVTFDDLSEKHEPLESDLRANPGQLTRLMRDMHLGADLYQRARGIHTAVIALDGEIFIQVEDIGRHNCLDRLAGRALMDRIDISDRILMSSGRISSEMINKARRLRSPIVCSRTSPTALSVALANAWNMTIVAYLRQNRMRIYTHPWRIPGAIPEGGISEPLG